jgi:hypothetical protein
MLAEGQVDYSVSRSRFRFTKGIGRFLIWVVITGLGSERKADSRTEYESKRRGTLDVLEKHELHRRG